MPQFVKDVKKGERCRPPRGATRREVLPVAVYQLYANLYDGCIWGLLFLPKFEDECFVNLIERWKRGFIHHLI